MSLSSQLATTVIVLDLDDTVYLERDYVRSGLQAVDRWVHASYGASDFMARAQARFDSGERGHLFNSTLEDLGIAPTCDRIAQLVKVYRQHVPDIAILPDAAAFIARARQVRALALLSDGPIVSQRNKIRALGLDRLGIWPLVCTDAWGRTFWKPHTRGFRHIQAHHGAASCQCLYVADNPAKDFIAPKRLGWRTICIKRPERVHQDPPPDPACDAEQTIESLDELTDSRLAAIFPAAGHHVV